MRNNCWLRTGVVWVIASLGVWCCLVAAASHKIELERSGGFLQSQGYNQRVFNLIDCKIWYCRVTLALNCRALCDTSLIEYRITSHGELRQIDKKGLCSIWKHWVAANCRNFDSVSTREDCEWKWTLFMCMRTRFSFALACCDFERREMLQHTTGSLWRAKQFSFCFSWNPHSKISFRFVDLCLHVLIKNLI